MDIFILLSSHAFGDYVFQDDFLANTKSKNIWHLLMHSIIYTTCVMIGFWLINHNPAINLLPVTLFVLMSHVIIDYLKSHEYISYVTDQISHIVILGVLGILSIYC